MTKEVMTMNEKTYADAKRFAEAAGSIGKIAPDRLALIQAFMAGIQTADAINEAKYKTPA